MKAINLTQAKHQLVTMPLYLVGTLFIAGWMAKPWLPDVIGFVTKAEAAEQAIAVRELGEQVTMLTTEFRMNGAYQMVRTTEKDLAEHEEIVANTLEWRVEKRGLEKKATLAREYKSCLQSEMPNCHLIQQQLWR